MTDYFLTAPKKIKRAGAARPYTVDLKSYLRSYWIAGRRYSANDKVRSPSVSGFAYQAQADGEAGQAEPAWPRTLGGTVTDGSIPWVAIAPGSNAVDTISSVVWSQINAPDGAVTINNQVNTIEEATAQFAGGTAGLIYRCQIAAATAGGNLYVVQFDLEIDGQAAGVIPTVPTSVSATLNTTQDDFAPPGYIPGVTNRLLLTPAAGGSTVKGLLAAPDGWTVMIVNQSAADSIDFPHQGSDMAANGFACPNATGATLEPLACCWATRISNQWRFV